MSIEKNIGLLAEATTELLEAVNVRKSTLDTKVQDAEASALQAASKAALAEAEKAATESAALQAETYKDATLTSLNTVKNDINYLELEAIAQTKSVSAVDVFVYDTSKDSDGGAWRKRTRKTSWYKEELNTATRGSRREFPSVAVIVAEAGKVTIYDGDDPSLPMWMVFSWGVRNFIGSFFGSTGVTSLSIKNGLLCIGQNGDGVSSIDFLKETAFKVSTPYVVNWNRTIDRRNENSSTNTNTYDKTIVNRHINEIAMTVLPDAPIDPATGLPVPTIAVATDGGVSVIKDDGTVVNSNIGGIYNTSISKVSFTGKDLWVALDSYYYGIARLNYPDYLGSNLKERWYAAGQGGGTIPLDKFIPYLEVTEKDQFAMGDTVGMVLANGSDRIGTSYFRWFNNSFAKVTSTYNTGWMHGDIKMAALSDTDATELVAESDELITNANGSNGTTGWYSPRDNSTISVVNNKITATPDSLTTFGVAQQIDNLEVGKTYTLKASLTSVQNALSFLRVSTLIWLNDDILSKSGNEGDLDVDNYFVATQATLYVGALATTPQAGASITLNEISVKEVQGVPAQQPVSTQRPTYNATTKSLELDLVDDSLVYNVPTGGIDGYMVIGTDQGTASYGVSLPEGPYEIGGDYFPGNEIHGFLLREGDSSTSELDTVEDYFVEQGAKASYGDVTSFSSYWRYKGITEFPLIDTSSGTNFSFAWRNNNLTSFPLIDTSSGTTFSYAWFNNNLTSFPLIDTSSGVSFTSTWQENNLTSFPLIDTSSGISFQYAWFNNTALSDFPANMFDNCLCTNFTGAFLSTGLTQTSIDGILVSIESNGTSNGTFGQSGGSAPSATGEAAIDALVTRGWTVSVTGGYQGKVLPEGLFENDENGFWYSMDIGE